MAINWVNNVSITLQFTLTSGATSIVLPTGMWALFSGATYPLRWVVEEFDGSNNVVKREVVSVTWIAGDQITIGRAVEPCPLWYTSTSQQQVAQVFNTPAKTKISIVMTKGMIDDINSAIATKLAKTELRTGLGAKKVLTTDASWNEVEISWTTGQVIGFGASNIPQAMTPSVDIHSLTQKTTPIGADEAIIWDSVSLTNQKALLKDLVIIADQTAQSSFSSDNDLFVVKQASGGLRKMTLADIRRALINSAFNTTGAKLIATSNSSVTTNTWTYSSSYATGSNAWGMISAFFRSSFSSSNFIDVSIQTSPDNSAWTDVWTDTFNANDGYPIVNGRAIAMVFNAAYVRIWVRSQTSSWSGYQIHGSATVNLTK